MTLDIRPAPVEVVRSAGGSRGRFAVAVPALALLVVVSTAWIGAWLQGIDVRGPAPVADAASTEGPLSGPPDGRGGTFPSHALGLPVFTGPELQARRAAGEIHGEPVAVAGILRSEPLPLTCPAIRLTLSRLFCHRLAALFEVPPEPGERSRSERRPSNQFAGRILDGHFLPGTYAPSLFGPESELRPVAIRDVLAILVGAFEDSRAPACDGVRTWCRDDFVVEQVVWADGVWLQSPIVLDTALPGRGPSLGLSPKGPPIARRTEGHGEIILSRAVLRPELLAVVDQLAWFATRSQTAVVWYVRSAAGAESGPPEHVVWAVTEDATGVVVGYSWLWPRPTDVGR